MNVLPLHFILFMNIKPSIKRGFNFYITDPGFEACFGWDRRCWEQNISQTQMMAILKTRNGANVCLTGLGTTSAILPHFPYKQP